MSEQRRTGRAEVGQQDTQAVRLSSNAYDSKTGQSFLAGDADLTPTQVERFTKAGLIDEGGPATTGGEDASQATPEQQPEGTTPQAQKIRGGSDA